jgi:hypothetical protein
MHRQEGSRILAQSLAALWAHNFQSSRNRCRSCLQLGLFRPEAIEGIGGVLSEFGVDRVLALILPRLVASVRAVDFYPAEAHCVRLQPPVLCENGSTAPPTLSFNRCITYKRESIVHLGVLSG